MLSGCEQWQVELGVTGLGAPLVLIDLRFFGRLSGACKFPGRSHSALRGWFLPHSYSPVGESVITLGNYF